MRLRTVGLGAVSVLSAAVVMGSLHGQASSQRAEEPRPVLVELFTSEGCSSCPPADALLRKINGMKSDSGQLIVGISEHVTYWNRLGWADPFSDEHYTERQTEYGNRFHLDGPYTPQMVINGERQVVGSDGTAVLRAIRAEGAESPIAIHIDSAAASGGHVVVTFSVDGKAPGAEADIYAVIADDEATSKVVRGENSGRTLSHVSVARSMTRIGTAKDSTSRTVTLPDVAGVRGMPGRGRHVILFAQQVGQGKVLSVESKAL